VNWTLAELTDTSRPWAAKFGHGTPANTFVAHQREWTRRKEHAAVRRLITDEIEAIFEPRYITPPETSEFIEALATMIDARRVLEIGMYSGFTTLHVLRAIIGKENAKITTIDGRPGLCNQEFFGRPEIAPWFEFVQDWTPKVLHRLAVPFDLVFVDSDHSLEHTSAELTALWPLTTSKTIFLFHDLPQWARPEERVEGPVRQWLLNHPHLQGLVLPTCEQLDCKTVWGDGYPPQCNPHLGVFIRK
jgi:predicted O-methyltransferase YrrM